MITVDQLRTIALGFPKAVEKPHFDWSSFRVDVNRGKIFATLPPHHEFSNVFLTPEEQAVLIASEPLIFFKPPNKWGDKGATSMRLAELDEDTLRSALTMSWRHAAPVKLRKEIEGRSSD